MYTVTKRERNFTLAGIMVALFLAALDQTIVATAMPKILQTLNGLNLYTWVVTAYLLASTSMIPIYGKISDLYGRKVVVLIAVSVFLAGSVLSGQARSMTELIVFRALQGLGSAGIFSTAFTVVADLFPPAERGKYQGLFGAVFGTSSVIGPWLGGLLTDNLSWRWVFYVNMPIGLIALLFIILQMPSLKPTLQRKVTIDWAGSAALLLGIIPILLALSLGGQEYPWGSWQVIGLFALGVVGVLVFILVERRAKEPILPFDLFQNTTFVVGNAAALLIAGVGFFGAIIFLPVYMVVVVGVSASAAGLTVMPLTLGVVVSSFLAGQIVSRAGRYKVLLLVGSAIVLVGYFLMQGLTISSSRWDVSWRMVILGLGLGPALPMYLLAVQNAVNPREIGAATGSSQFFRQIGSTVGVAIFGTILTTTLATQLPKHMPAEMRSPGTAAVSFNMGQLESGNFSAVGNQIRAGMQVTYQKIELALTKNDADARASLLADPKVPAELKTMLQNGGIEGRVKAGLDAQYQLVAAAVSSGKVAAITGLLADPRLPAPLKDQLGKIPMAAFASPQGQAGVLAGVRRGIDAQAPAIIQQATQSTLTQIKAGLDTAADRITGQVTSALKTSFTEAVKRVYFWGLFVIALGFIVTLFLPELALRKTHGHAPASAEAGTSSAETGSLPGGAAASTPASPET
jgi:EmrB/QacA subfamily drug resistance transporter